MGRTLLIALGLCLSLSGCSLCNGWFWQKHKAPSSGLFSSGCDQ